MFKRIFSITLLLATCATGAKAQYDVNFAHYFDMEPSFNPAAVGKEAKLNVTVAYALDFAGFKHNPQTAYAAADMPFYALKSYHGVGLKFMNDKIGLFTHQQLMAQYAYRFRLFGGRLATGIQLGLLSEDFNGSKANLEDSSDPAFATSDISGNGFDLAFGLYYTHGPWYVGLSGQHLTSPTVNLGETNELKIDPSFYLTGGYNIKLRNPFLTIKPSVLVRTDLSAYRADITTRLVYQHENKMLYLGAGLSVRSTFIRLGEEYTKRREEGLSEQGAYEEILLVCRELASGVPEAEAYADFGQRCRSRQYTRLSAILAQNLKKGNQELLSVMQQEAKASFEERQNTARKLGEEAETKLLLPMIMMLAITMLIIIIPAYYSFAA